MKRRLGKSWAVAAAALVACIGNRAAAQTPGVKLDLTQKQAVVNESVSFDVVVEYSEADEAPKAPEVPGCVVRFEGGPSQKKQIRNGRLIESSSRYHFSLVSREPGVLTIPAIEVKIKKKTYRTTPQTITITRTQSFAAAELRCAASRIYVGQRVHFVLRLWLKPVKTARGTLTRDYMARFIRSPQQRTGLFTFSRSGEARKAIGDGPEEMAYYFDWEADMRPEQPGKPLEDDVNVIVDYPTEVGLDAFRDVQVTGVRRLNVPIEGAVPDVMMPPTEGRPPGYNGAVGVFRIETSAKPTQVRLGDPIEFTMAIVGDGSLETLPAPDLSRNTELNEQFRVPSETLAGRMVGERKLFTQTIRAKTTDVREIPSIELPYFDPERGVYEVARSQTIPIGVAASSQLSEVDVVGMATSGDAKDSAAPQAVDGLQGNIIEEGRVLASVSPVRMSEVLAVAIVPPCVFALAWGWSAFASARNGNAVARRKQAALSNAQLRLDAAAKLPAADRSRETAAALAGYLADRLNEPPARFGGRASVEFLRQRGAPDDVIHQVATLTEQCDQTAYAGGAAADGALVDAARACLDRLERERL